MSNPDPSKLVSPTLAEILERTPGLERSFLVGGCVRDWQLDLPCKDVDVEVFGIDYDKLVNRLSKWGRTSLVGRSFGVVKLTLRSGETLDFTIPRRDSKSAPGHKGFEIELDPDISMKDAAARRDFTVNALMYDPRENRVHDFFNGVDHLDKRLLEPTSEAFFEDPLRVLRAMQFAGRFGFKASPRLIKSARAMVGSYGELAIERVWDEWFKWAAKSTVPSAGLRLLRDTGWIKHFPEIEALIGTPQDREWHPEGDVFVHTGHCCDALAKLDGWLEADESTRAVLMLAVLGHDFGKPAVTQRVTRNRRERIVSPGHDKIGGDLVATFLSRMRAPGDYLKRVPPLVVSHMAHLQAATPRSVRRLANRLNPETIEHLCLVIEADQRGRPPLSGEPSDGLIRLRKFAEDLSLTSKAPQPLLLGRDLIDQHGMKPGPEFGSILKAAFEAQLDGDFTDKIGALAWADAHIGVQNRRLDNNASESSLP